jgi:paraquat-inducible protein A
MQVNLLGMVREDRLGSGVISVWHEGWPILAIFIGLFAIVLPFIRFGLLSAVLGAVHLGHRPAWMGPAFRWAMWLDLWSMQDVFLLGCFVGYSRIHANLNVTIEAGGYCFIAAALLSMISRAALDQRTVWREILTNQDVLPPSDGDAVISCTTCDLVLSATNEGQRCPRCGARLQARKTDSLVRTVALITAGFILFWPANFYPMNIAFQGGQYVTYRIIDGVRELFRAGLAPLGVLIFCTSIAIPIVKILGLGWCVLSVVRRSRKHLIAKTRLYRLIDELGRWSNMDPFTIAVFVPLMNFEPFIWTKAAPGATPFILVVVFTMFASITFDPRLMWDAAEEGRR